MEPNSHSSNMPVIPMPLSMPSRPHPHFQTARRRPLSTLLLAPLLALSPIPHHAQAAQSAPAEADLERFSAGVRTTDPVPASQQIKQFRVPEGFEVQLVAEEPSIHKPMNLAFDDRGRLWVTTSREYPFAAPLDKPARDRVMIFEDFGADGRARKITTFAEGLNIPIGIYPVPAGSFRTFPTPTTPGERLKGDACIVWSIPNIWWIEDTDGDGRADRKELFFGPFDHTRDTHGNQASFRRGFDGWLYATHGFNNHSKVTGRDGHAVDMQSGNTYRMQLSGIRIEHHTHGQVNPFGLAWDPEGNLYSSDCHSAPTYQLLAGGFYPSFGKPHDGLGFAPVLMEHSHGSTAIDGMVFYADDLWPAEFRNNTFIGNVMTSRLNRDRLEFTGSSPKAIELPDFVRSEDPWFRPVDNLLGPDGALYIADFYNRIIGHYEVPLQHPGRDRERGRLWRVVYKGSPLRPAALPTSLQGLVAELRSPSLSRRMLAMNSLQDRFGTEARPPVAELVQKSIQSNPPSEADASALAHGLWLLQRLGHDITSHLNVAASFPDRRVRVHVQRILTEAPQASPRASALLLAGLQDPDALVQRCAAEGLGRIPSLTHLKGLLQARAACPPADTHLLYVLRKAIRDQLLSDPTLAQAAKESWTPTQLKQLLDVAIAVPTPAAASFLLHHLNDLSEPTSLHEVLRQVARFVPESELPTLAQAAQSRLQNDPAAQLDLFRSIDQGLQQRGLALPDSIQQWGVQLVTPLLRDGTTASQGWASWPLENGTASNPWNFEERTCSDGQKVRALSSLPGGESLTGMLRSADFKAPAKLSFYVFGHDGQPPAERLHKNKVRLVTHQNPPTVFKEVLAPRNDVGQLVEWDLGAIQGQTVHLEVVDQDTGAAYAWIAIARLTPEVVPWPRVAPKAAADQWIAACDLAVRLKMTAAAEILAEKTRSESADPQVRQASARAWTSLQPSQSIPELSALLQATSLSPLFKPPLGDLLSEQNSTIARQAVLQAIKDAPQRVQSRWALGLAASREGAEALLAAAEKGTVPPRLLQSVPLRNRIMSAAPHDWEKRHQSLVSSLPPGDEQREKLIQDRRSQYLAAPGQWQDGQRIFQQACALCHRIGGQGGLVGPQLDGIGGRGLERLCEDILDPNRNVDHAFNTTLITLKDGETVHGLFRRDEGELVVLANVAGQEVTVPKKEIQTRRENSTSLMPDNFGEALSNQDFKNLLAYLLQQRPK